MRPSGGGLETKHKNVCGGCSGKSKMCGGRHPGSFLFRWNTKIVYFFIYRTDLLERAHTFWNMQHFSVWDGIPDLL